MEDNKTYLKLIVYMIKNNFNQEFYSISEEIKKKLNIRVSKLPLFIIFLIYQYSFVLLLLLALYQIRNSTIFNLILGISLLCNIILPATIARTSAIRMSTFFWSECLQMTDLEEEIRNKITFSTELINFWLHNMFMEVITLSLLIVKFNFIGLLYCILWVFLVSVIYVKTLSKNSYLSRQTIYPIVSHLFDISLSFFLTYKLFEIFISSLEKTSLQEVLKPNQIDHYIMVYVKHVMLTLNNQLLTILAILIAFFIVKSLIYVCLKKSYRINERKIVNRWYKIYFNCINRWLKNFWMCRDLKLIFNILSKVNMNPLQLIFPTGIVFIIASCIYYFLRMVSPYQILVSLVFILWVTLYQFTSFLIQKLPILNISSELFNIELIKMSDRTFEELISSKHLLLALFCLPILLGVWIIKFILLIIGVNPIVLSLSFISDLLMCWLSVTLVLKWTYMMPNYTWKNIFMIKQDNYDQQIIQHFLLIPGRLITLFFSISFVFVNIVNTEYKLSLLVPYFLLNIIIVSAVLFILKKKGKNELKRD